MNTTTSPDIKCANCGRFVPKEDTLAAPDGDIFCTDCHVDVCTHCDQCGALIWFDDANSTPDSSFMCNRCFVARCVYCEDCGMVIWRSQCVSCCDGYYCTECALDNDVADSPATFESDNRHNRMVSKRRFGVEIETHTCDGYRGLVGNICFDIKDDGSISGKEFASTILDGDKGLEAIEDLCDFGASHGWSVSIQCGLHIHLDMSKEKTAALKSVAIAYLMTRDFWRGLVDESRWSNFFCGNSSFETNDIEGLTSFIRFARQQTRYEWFNVAAYTKFKTFEIRLHQGSINAEQICNWIRIHTLFVDWAASKTCNEVTEALEWFDREALLGGICHAAGCDDLVAYYHLTPAKMVV